MDGVLFTRVVSSLRAPKLPPALIYTVSVPYSSRPAPVCARLLTREQHLLRQNVAAAGFVACCAVLIELLIIRGLLTQELSTRVGFLSFLAPPPGLGLESSLADPEDGAPPARSFDPALYLG